MQTSDFGGTRGMPDTALVRECGLAIELVEDPPFEAARLDLVARSRVVAAGTPDLVSSLAAALG